MQVQNKWRSDRPSLAANADDSNGVYFACAFEMQRIFSKIEPLLSEQNIGVFQKIIIIIVILTRKQTHIQ